MQLILTRTVGVIRKVVYEVCENMPIIEKKRGLADARCEPVKARNEAEQTQSQACIAVPRLFLRIILLPDIALPGSSFALHHFSRF